MGRIYRKNEHGEIFEVKRGKFGNGRWFPQGGGDEGVGEEELTCLIAYTGRDKGMRQWRMYQSSPKICLCPLPPLIYLYIKGVIVEDQFTNHCPLPPWRKTVCSRVVKFYSIYFRKNCFWMDGQLIRWKQKRIWFRNNDKSLIINQHVAHPLVVGEVIGSNLGVTMRHN